MRELLSTLTKRGILSFAALVLAFSTVTPLATAQTAGAATPEYRLTAQPTALTVEKGSEVKSFYVFAEYRIQNCILWWCEWTGWNDLPAWQNSPLNATVAGSAEVSVNTVNWGAVATATNPQLDPKIDGTFYVKAATTGSSTINLAATVQTVLGGTRQLSAAVVVNAQDTTAPTVPTLSLSAGATQLVNGGFTNSNAVTASWNVPAGDPVKYDYKYWNNIASSAHNGEANAWVNPGIAGNQYSGVFNQGEGTHYMQVRAIDAAGNASAWSTPFVITYDVTLPTVQIKTGSGESDGTQGKDNTFSRISFKLNDPNGGLKEVVLNGNVYPRENMWNDLNWLNIDKSHLIEGVNTIYAIDRAGNQSVALSFTYDKTAPTITVKNNYVGDLDAKIFSNVSFSLYDAYKVDKYVINGFTSDFTVNKWSDANFQNIKSKLNQGLNTLTVYDIAGNSSAYEFTYDSVLPTANITYSNNNGNALTKNDVTATLTANEEVQDIAGWTRTGANTFTKVFTANGSFTVSFVDVAGNTASRSGEVKRIDRNAPTISGVTNGALVKGPVTLSIFDPKYQGFDGFDKATGLKVNGTTVATTEAAGKTYLATISADGTYTVVATDKAGNVSETVTFTIDSVAPVVTANDITATTFGTTANISGTVNDPTINTVEVFVDGVSVGTANVTAGEYDFNLTGLSVGEHNVAVKAVDAAGNTGTSAVKVAVVNPVPVVVPAVVGNGPATLAASPAVQPNANVAIVDNNNDQEVLGESTQNVPKDEAKEVLAATTTPEVKGASDFAPFGLSWYWWLPILAALVGAAWWLFAAWRRRQSEEA